MKPTDRDPREEKVLDYQKHRANTYGENDKSSRKAIRFRKAWVNRTYRRDVHQALATSADLDEAATQVQRKRWSKRRDVSLAVDVEKHLATRDRKGISETPDSSPARKEALKRLRRRGLDHRIRWANARNELSRPATHVISLTTWNSVIGAPSLSP